MRYYIVCLRSSTERSCTGNLRKCILSRISQGVGELKNSSGNYVKTVQRAIVKKEKELNLFYLVPCFSLNITQSKQSSLFF